MTSLRNHLWIKTVLIAFIFTLISIIPLMIWGIPNGQDLEFHAARIQGMADLIHQGIYSFKILPGFFNDYGYAMGIFYPSIFFIIPAFLVAYGMPIVASYIVLIAIVTFVTYLSMFIFSHYLTKSYRMAHLASLVYIFGAYRLYTDLLWRAATAELISFAFIPLVFLGIDQIMRNDYKKWYWLTIGMSGLLLTHVISSALTFVFLVVYFIVFVHHVIKEPKRLLYLALATLITILLSLFYLAPLIEMMLSDQFVFNTPWIDIATASLNHWNEIVYSTYQQSIFPFGVDALVLLTIFISLFLKGYRGIKDKLILLFIGLTIFIIFFNFKSFNKESWMFLNFMQFPWRLFLFSSFFLSIILVMSLEQIKVKKYKIVVLFLLPAFMIISYFNYSYQYTEVTMNQQKWLYFYGYPSGTNFDDYLSLSVQYDTYALHSYDRAIEIDQSIDLSYQRNGFEYEIYFDQKGLENTSLIVPFFFYEGYAAYYMNENGEGFLPITKSENGLTKVSLSDIPHGTIYVFYNGTRIQKYSMWVSVITLFVSLAYLLKMYISRKKSKTQLNYKNIE